MVEKAGKIKKKICMFRFSVQIKQKAYTVRTRKVLFFRKSRHT